jgi:hypothetical protein
VRKNRTGENSWRVDADVVDLVRARPGRCRNGDCGCSQSNREDDGQGAFVDANAGGPLRNIHGIAVYREGERAERGEATLDETAERPRSVRRRCVT